MVPSLSLLVALLPLAAAIVQSPVIGSTTGDLSAQYRVEQQALIDLAQKDLRLIQTGETTEPRWILEEDKDALRRAGIRFMDITDHQDLGKSNAVSMTKQHKKKSSKYPDFPHKVSQKDIAHKYLKNLDQSNMRDNLALLTAFHTRYYKSQSGAASGDFLFHLVQNITSIHNQTIDVKQFEHAWGQHSVIARIQGSESNKTVVIGAHQDSAAMFLPMILAAPGADDDGSGTVTTLEVLRVLSAGQFRPRYSVEFHWYSAEEGGLLGSQAIFASYEKEGKEVIAMLQQDMTGYVSKTIDAGLQESLGVITDFVDPSLTKFIKTVIEGYCAIPWVETQCGYACSDHASASRAGYRSAFVIESEFKYSNPAIHSGNDVMEHLSFTHMLEHAKLTTGFAVELGMMEKHSKKGKKHRKETEHAGL